VKGRWGRRSRKLLDDLKERRGRSHLKEEALDGTTCRHPTEKDFGPVVRQTAKRMKAINILEFKEYLNFCSIPKNA
jgi:hypothetical protein